MAGVESRLLSRPRRCVAYRPPKGYRRVFADSGFQDFWQAGQRSTEAAGYFLAMFRLDESTTHNFILSKSVASQVAV